MLVLMQAQPDYNFIMDANHKPKKPLLPGGNSKQGRIMIVVGGVVLLLVIGSVVMMLLASAGKSEKQNLTKAAQQQAEIIRISKIGIDKARGSTARNLAMTTNLSMQSDQIVLLKQGNVSAKEAALGKNTKTDVTLTSAEQSNKFDEVFTQTLQAELKDYQMTLVNTYHGAKNKTLKATLDAQYQHAYILINGKNPTPQGV